MTYAEKLKKPEWQRRRLEILSRDQFTCQLCGDKETELHVHHKSYSGEPWDANDTELETLCKHCHASLEEMKNLNFSCVPIKAIKHDYPGGHRVISFAIGRKDGPKGMYMFFYDELNNDIEFLIGLEDTQVHELSEFIKGLNSVQPSQSPATAEE